MKITSYTKNLKRALGIVEKIVSKNTSLPILNNILLKTENGRLKISATNLEIGVSYLIGTKIDEVGEVAIPARIASDFVGNINEEKISLSTKNNILSIDSEHYKTQILGFDPKDFPIIPKIKNDTFCVINSKVIKNSLMTVLDSVALSETRPELAGVLMSFLNNKLIFAATDSFRLTEKITDFNCKENKTVIIPRNTALELIRISSDIEGDMDIKIGDNQISFSNNDIELISRLVDGNYPDYKKVIPDKFLSKVIVDKEVIEKNTRLAGLFSSNIADVKIKCSDKKMVIVSKNSEKGEIQTSMECVLKNEPFDIAVNFNYLLDGLKIIPANKIVIEFTGQGSPLVLRPENDNKNLTYLIMPLRS